MAVYQVIFTQRIDDYAVVQTLTEPELDLGLPFTLASSGATFNGTHNVYALPPYLFTGVDSQGDLLFNYQVPIPNQVLFYDAGDDAERTALIPQGTLTYVEVCTWVLGPAVGTWLGIALAGVDESSFLTQCASSASNFIFRRRQESGIHGQPDYFTWYGRHVGNDNVCRQPLPSTWRRQRFLLPLTIWVL